MSQRINFYLGNTCNAIICEQKREKKIKHNLSSNEQKNKKVEKKN